MTMTSEEYFKTLSKEELELRKEWFKDPLLAAAIISRDRAIMRGDRMGVQGVGYFVCPNKYDDDILKEYKN